MIAPAFVFAALTLASSVPLVVEKHGVTATVEGDLWSPGNPGDLKVTLAAKGRSRSWSYTDTWLDPEETGIAQTEILSAGGREWFLVHTFSGGARCCWALLLYDVKMMRSLGSQLQSESPIRVAAGKGHCLLEARVHPVTKQPGVPTAEVAYCFDGKRFSRKRRAATPRRRPHAG